MDNATNEKIIVATKLWLERAVIGLNPVSYTHLRAHETVLDLVCRLLLEKKKHYQNQLCLLLTP